MRISDWSSDVCSSDLRPAAWLHPARPPPGPELASRPAPPPAISSIRALSSSRLLRDSWLQEEQEHPASRHDACADCCAQTGIGEACIEQIGRSEEHTSELQSLMRISYAVFCLKKKTKIKKTKQSEKPLQ